MGKQIPLPCSHETESGTSTVGWTPQGMGKTLTLMQNFMLKKGLINKSMSEEEIQNYLMAACEGENNQNNDNSRQQTPVKNNKTTKQKQEEAAKQLTPEEQSDQVVRDAEISKAKLPEVAGKNNLISVLQFVKTTKVSNPSTAQIDEDYQMIDSHIDKTLKAKIQGFEYVDFGKLISKSQMVKDEEQCMEIVTRDGMTFLSPVSERDNIQINSYHKWEQAYCVFSNILTTKYPEKVTELFQYRYTIQMAASAYVCDNVYGYDKEFHHHISRHPTRSWAIILQQAWTMLLKDRVRNSGKSYFQKGHHSGGYGKGGNKKDRETCRRFNKGRCTYGLSCHYDHRCSVKKCGKFGHGAHICRLRGTETEGSSDGGNAGMEKLEKPERTGKNN